MKNDEQKDFFILEGNTSHRIERLNFGPRIFGAITPLAGTEQISLSGFLQYFNISIKVSAMQ